MTRAAARAGGAAAFLSAVLWLAAAWSFLPSARSALDATVADIGSGLLRASHPASVHVPYRMPFDPLLENALLHHASAPAAAALAVLAAALLSFALGAELAGSAGGALASGVWALIFRSLPYGPGFYKQVWLSLLVVGAAWALVRGARKEAGAWIGLSLLARTSLFFLPPLLALRERKLKPALVWLLPYAFLIPWILMNAAVLGEFVPLEHGPANMNIVTGAIGTTKTAHGDFARLMDAPSTGYASPFGWAVRRIAAEPRAYAEGVLTRIAGALSLYPPLWLLALAGLIRRRSDPSYRVLAVLSAYFVLINCAMSVEDNHFEPLWPLLAALGTGVLPAAAPSRRLVPVVRAVLVFFLLLAAVSAALCVRYAFTAAPDSPAALEAALARAPDDPALLLRRARRLGAEGRAAEGEAYLERAWPVLSDLPRARLLRAWLLAKQGRPELLLEGNYTAWPELDAFNDHTREAAPLYQALALDALGRRKEALEKLEAALAASRGARSFIAPNGSVAALQERLKDGSDAAFASRSDRILEDDSAADRAAARVLLRAARPGISLPAPLLRRPAAAAALNDAAVAAEKAGDRSLALARAREAVAAAPDWAEASLTLGALLEREKKPAEAKAVYRAALSAGAEGPLRETLEKLAR